MKAVAVISDFFFLIWEKIQLFSQSQLLQTFQGTFLRIKCIILFNVFICQCVCAACFGTTHIFSYMEIVIFLIQFFLFQNFSLKDRNNFVVVGMKTSALIMYVAILAHTEASLKKRKRLFVRRNALTPIHFIFIASRAVWDFL